jgi:hypothetical protein
VRLDDLATLRSAPHSVPDDRRIGNANNSASTTSHLQGLQQGFLRRNAALLVRLRDTSGRTVVVANAHLYWNPGFEYVKVRHRVPVVPPVDQCNNNINIVLPRIPCCFCVRGTIPRCVRHTTFCSAPEPFSNTPRNPSFFAGI